MCTCLTVAMRGTGGSSLRLLVFRNGQELLGSYRIDVLYATGDAGKLGRLVPATDVTAAQRSVAKEVAMTEQGSAERSRADAFFTAWDEEVACAVAQHKEARDALADAVIGERGSAMDKEEARDLDRAAERGIHSEEERRQMRASASNKRVGAEVVAKRGTAGAKKLEKFTRKYKRGCLAKIAPVQ